MAQCLTLYYYFVNSWVLSIFVCFNSIPILFCYNHTLFHIILKMLYSRDNGEIQIGRNEPRKR